AAELAAHMRGLVGHDIGTAFIAGDVDELGPLAVGRRPEVGAAVHVGAGVLEDVGAALPLDREILHVLARIIVDRLAGLGIDAFGPGHLIGVLRRLEELAVLAIECVVEAVAVGVDEKLAIVAVDLAVDDDLRTGGIIVAIVVRGMLEEPLHLSGCVIERARTVGDECVVRPMRGVIGRGRVAGAVISDVLLRIVGAGPVHRAAAGLPGVGLVLPGLAAGLAGGGDHERLPLLLAGLGIEPGE